MHKKHENVIKRDKHQLDFLLQRDMVINKMECLVAKQQKCVYFQLHDTFQIFAPVVL